MEAQKDSKITNPEPTRAKKLWAKLRENVLSKRPTLSCDKNVKYNLFEKKVNTLHNQSLETVYQISQNLQIITKSPLPKKRSIVDALKDSSSIEAGTTGLWIWEAEQVMTYFLMNNSEIFKNSSKMLQLGAGTSGLCGLTLSKMKENYPFIKSVHITDGYLENIQFLRGNIVSNNLKQKICACMLLWGRSLQNDIEKESFDLIAAADCLFFSQSHLDLIKTLDYCLSREGSAVFVNPNRGNSAQMFIKKAVDNGFTVKMMDLSDGKYQKQVQRVSSLKDFDEDRDLFRFILLKRNQQNKGCAQQQI